MSSHRRIVDLRGNAHDRRVRRDWIMSPAAGFGGSGRAVRCFHCGHWTWRPQIDRFPICGHDGGRYVRGNIVPSCKRCNGLRGRVCRQGQCYRNLIVAELARAA